MINGWELRLLHSVLLFASSPNSPCRPLPLVIALRERLNIYECDAIIAMFLSYTLVVLEGRQSIGERVRFDGTAKDPSSEADPRLQARGLDRPRCPLALSFLLPPLLPGITLIVISLIYRMLSLGSHCLRSIELT